jgi:hypothetical protein
MAPLMNAPSVIPKLILNLCTISIAMCNKFFNQMTPFNGDKVRPRITAKAGGNTFLGFLIQGLQLPVLQLNHIMLLSPILSLIKYKILNTALPPLATK